MANRPLSPGLLLVTALSVLMFFSLAAWGWGSIAGLMDHPARTGALLVIAIAAFASLFTGIHLGGCTGKDAQGQWLLAPLVLISLAMAWFPAFADHRDLATIDGDATRYLGLVLLAIGAVLRVGPMFILGDRFTWPLAKQRVHPLMTSGFYRFIRHPSYLGAVLGGIGWVLVFRSGAGLVLIALLFPVLLPVVRAEESLLETEFGEDYAAYRRRTWRLVPFIY